jgi:hypothetical protein
MVAVLVAAGLFTGCGGGGSSNASATDQSSESTSAEQPSGPLTKAEFLKQADQICREGSEKKEDAVLSLAKSAAESKKPPSPQALEKVAVVTIFPTYGEIIDQLGELEPPHKDTAQVEKMITKYEADLKIAEAEPIKAIKENLFAEANDLGDTYGLEACHL